MKLSTKLSLGMGTLSFLILIIAIVAYTQMRNMNVATEEVTQNWLPNIITIQEMDKQAQVFRNFEILHIYSESQQDFETYEKRMADISAFIEQGKANYSKMITLPEEKTFFEQYSRFTEQYLEVHAHMVELSRQLKTSEAINLLLTDSSKIFDNMAASLKSMVELATTESNKAAALSKTTFNQGQTGLIMAVIISILLAVGLSVVIIRGTLRQLGKDPQELGTIAKSVAGGNLDLKAEGTPLGVYADILVMVAKLKETIEAAHQESINAQQQAEAAHKAMTAAEKASNEAAEKTRRMLVAADALENVANIVSSASAQLSAQIEQSRNGAESSAARLAETATAMEEMNSTVIEVAKNASEASTASSHMREEAEHGAQIVLEAVTSIQEVRRDSATLKDDMAVLAQQAQAINQIMGVISDIADQTNLLALNAAIEAARAGEAGRGFAVVADEVRKLAEKTMESTTDVGNAIKSIQASTAKSIQQVDTTAMTIEKATQLSEESGAALKSIVKIVDMAADQVRAIATASEQQSASSEEINMSLTQVNAIAGETASAMQESALAVIDLARQAQVLTTLIDDMKKG